MQRLLLLSLGVQQAAFALQQGQLAAILVNAFSPPTACLIIEAARRFDPMVSNAPLSNLEKLILSLSSRPSSKAQSAGAKADPSHPPFAACSAGPASNQKHATKVDAPSKACSECHKTRVLSERCSEDGLQYCSECWDRYDTYPPPPEQKPLPKAARHR